MREDSPVAELARTLGVHRSRTYQVLARHRAEGDPSLAPRPRKPRT